MSCLWFSSDYQDVNSRIDSQYFHNFTGNYLGFCKKKESKNAGSFPLLLFWLPNGGSLFQAFQMETLNTIYGRTENASFSRS